MTREETKKAIEIMQAYVDGKEIEDFYAPAFNNAWYLQQDPTWNWTSREYRIKEEPKLHYIDHNIQCVVKAAWKEEPKPWDWRGKNIQWVRYGIDDNSPWKPAQINEEGIFVLMNLLGKLGHQFFAWEQLKNGFEWSEDNQTWRPFV